MFWTRNYKWFAELSLSARLMIYSAVFTFALLIVFWTSLFLMTEKTMSRQNREMLKTRIATLSSLLDRESGPSQSLNHRVMVEWFQRDFERIFVRILDSQGAIVVATPTMDTAIVNGLSQFESVKDPKKLEDQIIRIEGDGHVYRAMADQIKIVRGMKTEKYLLEVAIDRTNEQSLLSNFGKFFIFLLLIGGLSSLWLGRTMVRISLRPVRDITTMAEGVNSERLDERIIPASLPVEFREVAVTINDMLDRLKQYVDRLTRFSQDMAHELRTPVNNLLGSMEVALSRERPISEYKNILGSGIEECDRLKRIIDSLLFIARTSDPSHVIDKKPLDIGQELEAIASFYRFSAEEKGILLELEGATHTTIYAERTHLQRCIGNLISNSIRHSRENSKIILKVEESDNQIVVKVNDSGCGIPAAHLHRIGERFFRADESRSKTLGGTGLGLSIVKSIVEMHGGQMYVQSKENVGTEVSLVFPKTTTPLI